MQKRVCFIKQIKRNKISNLKKLNLRYFARIAKFSHRLKSNLHNMHVKVKKSNNFTKFVLKIINLIFRANK